MAKLLGSDAAAALSGGAGADRANFQMVLEQARRFTGNGTQGKELQAENSSATSGCRAISRPRLGNAMGTGALDGARWGRRPLSIVARPYCHPCGSRRVGMAVRRPCSRSSAMRIPGPIGDVGEVGDSVSLFPTRPTRARRRPS